MNIQCPNCAFSDDVDDSKIPPKGGIAKCPKCGHRFPIKKPQNQAPATDIYSAQTVVFKSPAYVQQTAATSAEAPPSVNKLSFHGSGGTLLGIYIMNILFTIFTFSIYRFWGKVKVRKYLYSQTELMADRFAYHGTGKELFIGWLKAVGLFIIGYGIIIGLAKFIHPFFLLLIYPAFIVIIPFALVGAMRYRLSRTSWYGIRFSFRGGLKTAIGLYAGGLFLTAITLGLYYPVFHAKMQNFWRSNSYFGNTPFEYDGKGKDLLGSFILAVFLGILTLGIYWFWYAAKAQRYDWAHTAFSDIRFKSTVTGGKLFFFTLTNLLLIVFTLGLGFPWAITRSFNFHFDNLILEGSAQMDKIKQDAQAAHATADSIADFMNIDSGLV